MSIRWGLLREGVQCYELFEGIALKNHAFCKIFILSGKMPDSKDLLQIYVNCLIIDSIHSLIIIMLILFQSAEVLWFK